MAGTPGCEEHEVAVMKKADRAALRQFDELPTSAHVRLPVVGALYGISPATIWRWSRSGHLPAPVHINGVTLWNVGALRLHMTSKSAVPVVDRTPSEPSSHDSEQEE